MPLLAVLLTAAALTTPPRPPAPEPDAVRAARRAQRAFEYERRSRLSEYETGGDGSTFADQCPVRIGRLCWWDNNDDGTPPPERSDLVRAREQLLGTLARAAAADSTNDWVYGQQVRYALEAGRLDDALAAARACRGTLTWCVSLRGVALHAANRHAEAAAAFDSADALRSDAERCAWRDVSVWLESGTARAYRRLPCGSPERARWEARFWRLAQPLWSLPANDLRNEWNARRVMARVHGDGSNPYGMSWGDDLAECEERYGWPTAWSTRYRTGVGIWSGPDDGRGVIGWEPAPSYFFVPRKEALAPGRAGVADVPDGSWNLRPPPDDPREMRYAPRYARGGIGTPTHQIARFRHGDTTLVLGAYDTTPDSIWANGSTPPTLSAALLLLNDSGAVVGAEQRDSAARAGALVARVLGGASALGPHALLGLELLQRDTVHTPDGRRVFGRALRARTTFRPLAADARLSDLLLLRHSPGPTPTWQDVVDSAAGTTVLRPGAATGLYWEQYRPPGDTATAPDTVVIAATRLTRTWRERIVGLLGRSTIEHPIALRFADNGARGVGRAIGVTWPEVPSGDYRIDLTLVPGTPGRMPATTSLVVHMTND